jgi:antitoxin CcdA
MQDRPSKPKKKAVNLSIDASLAEDAKAAGTNLSAVLERALIEELRAHREQTWRDQNRASIEASNAELRRNGLWADSYRGW